MHTSFIEHYHREGELWVLFRVNPLLIKVLQDLDIQVDSNNSYLLGDSPEKHYEQIPYMPDKQLSTNDLKHEETQ